MSSLFEQPNILAGQPLAARMRPRNLDEFIGQDAIMAPGRLLRRAIKADQIASLIFYGPPGTGKTTLAQVIAATTKARFVSLNAVLAGIKELREALDEAKEQKALYSRKTILFVDEVHRWNKSQQDALLPWTENGTIILIGATTENPFFEVNRALVSRSRLFQLQSLTDDNLMMAAHLALNDKERGYGLYDVRLEAGALEHLVSVAKGDCRMLYNALELAIETTPSQFPPANNEPIIVTLEIAEESIQRRALLYDKDGDYHYDTISAFIKSITGSDPDAALYWLARMLLSGEDPSFIWRRLLVLASEDIGLADPQAVAVVNACAMSYERLGMPEGRIPLSQATLYLATALKSNSALAIFDALKEVEQSKSYEVPNHLKDSNRDGKALGHGKNYKYPHAFTNHWTAQAYLPDNLKGKSFYVPGTLGYEGQLAERVIKRKEEQLALVANDETNDVFSFSPSFINKEREHWLKRAEQDSTRGFALMREKIFECYPVNQHATSLMVGDKSGYLVAEALRRSPQGGHYSFASNATDKENLIKQFSHLSPQEQPIFLIENDLSALPSFVDVAFVFLPSSLDTAFAMLNNFDCPPALLILCLNGVGFRLSQLVADLDPSLLGSLLKVEEQSYQKLSLGYYQQYLAGIGFNGELKPIMWQEKRYLSKNQIERWLGDSVFGRLLREECSADALKVVSEALLAAGDQEVEWQRVVYLGSGGI